MADRCEGVRSAPCERKGGRQRARELLLVFGEKDFAGFGADRRADDAVLLNREGYLTEGTTANVFVVKDDRVRTPTMESGILGGITLWRL